MESGTRNEGRRPGALEPASRPADGGDLAEVEGMDRGPADREAPGAEWREFPTELVPVDMGWPGPVPGAGWPTRADQPSPVCAEPGGCGTAGRAALQSVSGTRRCQSCGPARALHSGCGCGPSEPG